MYVKREGGYVEDYVGNWSKMPFWALFGKLPHIGRPLDERVRSSFPESCKI